MWEKKDKREPGESSRSNEERNGIRKGWMEIFITMKLGPPQNLTKGGAAAMARLTEMGERSKSQWVTTRPVGMVAKKRIEFLLECTGG